MTQFKRFGFVQAGVRFAAAAFLVLGLSNAAFAANTWLPKYDSTVHLQIAPDVSADTRQNIQDSTLTSDIDALSAQYGLEVHVIVTSTGNDITGDVVHSGAPLVRQTWDMWVNHGMPSSRAVIILMTGTPGGHLNSVGVRAGEWLNSLGVNRD